MSEIENINLPEDLKKLDIKEKEKLSAEIRKEILMLYQIMEDI